MQYSPALGTCQKCGQSKIQVEGNVKCLLCDVEAGNSGLVVKVEDPGHDMMDKLLAKAGVTNIPGGKPPEAIRSISRVETAKVVEVPRVEAKAIVVSGSGIDQALQILRALPMPKDIKQFKAINKAIKILEDLGA